MIVKIRALAACLSGLLLTAGVAAATTIDFEGHIPNTQINSDYASLGVVFSTSAYYRQCGSGCPNPAFGIFASSSDFISPFDVVFFGGATNSVSFINVANSSVLARAFDINGNFISSVTDTQGNPITGIPDVLNGPGIYSVEFSSAGNLFGIDDLTFTSVPEPANWALIVIGFGAAGAMVRGLRRQRVPG